MCVCGPANRERLQRNTDSSRRQLTLAIKQTAQRRCLPRKQPLVRNGMKEKGEKGAIVRENDRMTHRTEMCFFFLCVPACLCSVHVCLLCVCALSLPLALSQLSQWRLRRWSPTGVSHVRNIKGQFNLARPRLQSILISTAVTEELIFDLSEVGPGPVNHCNSH